MTLKRTIAAHVLKLAPRYPAAFDMALRQIDPRLPLLYHNYHNAGYSVADAVEKALMDIVERDSRDKA